MIDPTLADRLVRQGEDLLKIFREESAHNPTSAEFHGRKLTEWRHQMALLYGEAIANTLVIRVRSKLKLKSSIYEPVDDSCTVLRCLYCNQSIRVAFAEYHKREHQQYLQQLSAEEERRQREKEKKMQQAETSYGQTSRCMGCGLLRINGRDCYCGGSGWG